MDMKDIWMRSLMKDLYYELSMLGFTLRCNCSTNKKKNKRKPMCDWVITSIFQNEGGLGKSMLHGSFVWLNIPLLRHLYHCHCVSLYISMWEQSEPIQVGSEALSWPLVVYMAHWSKNQNFGNAYVYDEINRFWAINYFFVYSGYTCGERKSLGQPYYLLYSYTSE